MDHLIPVKGSKETIKTLFEEFIKKYNLTDYSVSDSASYGCFLVRHLKTPIEVKMFTPNNRNIYVTKKPICKLTHIGILIDSKTPVACLSCTDGVHPNSSSTKIWKMNDVRLRRCCPGTLAYDKNVKFDTIQDYFNNIPIYLTAYRLANTSSPMSGTEGEQYNRLGREETQDMVV